MRRERGTGWMRKYKMRKKISPYLYILPAVIPILLFFYWPLLYNAVLSFMDWDLISPNKNFVGLKNFRSLFGREDFQLSLINTGKYVLGLFPLSIVIPLALSLLVLSIRRLRGAYESLLFIPTVLSFSVACFVWIWMYTPFDGVIAKLFNAVGLRPLSWLADHRVALWSIVIVSGWRMLGYHQLICGSALKAIPEEIIEAALIDGAGPWRRFWSIKLPLISPTIFFLLVTTVIFVSDYVFIPIHILTRGGPYNSTNNLIYLVYQYGFRYFNAGLAGATALITFGLFAVVAFLIFYFGERKVHYEN